MEFCRCCLMKLDKSILFSEANNLSLSKDLREKFEKCSTLPVNLEDEFPKHLCNVCLEKINYTSDFQKMCKESQKRFQNVAKTSDSLFLTIDEKFQENLLPECPEKINNEPKSFIAKEKSSTISLNGNIMLEEDNINYQIKENMKEDLITIANDLTKDSQVVPNDMELHSSRIYPEENIKFLSFKEPEEVAVLEAIYVSTIEQPAAPANEYPSSKTTSNFNYKMVSNDLDADNMEIEDMNNNDFVSDDDEDNQLNEIQLPNHPCHIAGCDKVYSRKTALAMHLRSVHNEGPAVRNHICEICGKLFNSTPALKRHIYVHRERSELPFVCDVENCQRRFTNKEKLKIHKLRHAGIKKYSCPFCGMRKTTKHELNVHVNYHTLERTWPCKYCPKVCHSAGNLKIHVRTVHERAKDYSCSFCEQTFAKAETRKYHEMTHTGEKPHVCAECGKRFTQPAALRTHKKIHLKNQNPNNENNPSSNEEKAENDEVLQSIQNNLENINDAESIETSTDNLDSIETQSGNSMENNIGDLVSLN